MAHKVLVADDSIASQRLFELVLTREGYDVITVESGTQVLDAMQEKHPDLAFIDAIMPEVDGYQLCKQIKEHPNFQHLPIILLAGSYEDFDREKGINAVGNENAILNKPAKSAAILSKVKEFLTPAPAEEPEPAVTESVSTAEVISEPPLVQEEYEFDEDSEEVAQMVEDEILDLEEEAALEEVAQKFDMEQEIAGPAEAVQEAPASSVPAEPQPVQPVTPGIPQISDEKLDTIADEIAQRLAKKLVPVLMQELASYFMQFPAVSTVIEHTSKQLAKDLLPEIYKNE